MISNSDWANEFSILINRCSKDGKSFISDVVKNWKMVGKATWCNGLNIPIHLQLWTEKKWGKSYFKKCDC